MTWQMRQITVRTIRKLSMGNIFASTSRTYRACRLPTRSGLKSDFTLRDIVTRYPQRRTTLAELLEPTVDAKYILTPVLWKYLYRYAKSIRRGANGFGYGMV